MIVVRTALEMLPELHEADTYKVNEDGSLTIYQHGRIGPYRCPLKLDKVATYAPGSWKGVEVKDE